MAAWIESFELLHKMGDFYLLSQIAFTACPFL